MPYCQYIELKEKASRDFEFKLLLAEFPYWRMPYCGVPLYYKKGGTTGGGPTTIGGTALLLIVILTMGRLMIRGRPTTMGGWRPEYTNG